MKALDSSLESIDAKGGTPLAAERVQDIQCNVNNRSGDRDSSNSYLDDVPRSVWSLDFSFPYQHGFYSAICTQIDKGFGRERLQQDSESCSGVSRRAFFKRGQQPWKFLCVVTRFHQLRHLYSQHLLYFKQGKRPKALQGRGRKKVMGMPSNLLRSAPDRKRASACSQPCLSMFFSR